MHRVFAFVLLLATVAFVLAPYYTPSFSGFDPDRFPVRIENPAVQPAPYAFSIWGVIYVWLILHAGFGLWKRGDDPIWHRVRLPLTVAVVLGTVWLAIATSSPIWATEVIWVMAVASLAAFLIAPTEPDRWLLSAPIAMFAGWLTAAASVSTGILLAGYGVMGDTTSALVILGAVLILALVMQSQKPRMPVYGLTIVWALVGVIVTNWPGNALVAGAAAAGAALMLLATAVFWQRG
ncbi:MAG: hypothetical protein EON48_10510 [Acetobacteraceae bacterium]|nr:MAG: hypothetical protein EON48_10510 [Acetobacteraceae bacterium]